MGNAFEEAESYSAVRRNSEAQDFKHVKKYKAEHMQ